MAPHGPAAGRGPSRPAACGRFLGRGAGGSDGARLERSRRATRRVCTGAGPRRLPGGDVRYAGTRPLAGRATNLPEISEAIHAVARACGPVHAIIGHSFGVPCTFYAVQHGLKVNRIVAISPPDNVRHLTQKFFIALNVAPRVQEVFSRTIETHYGADLWQRFSTEVMARQLDVPGLVIHDQDDRDVPIEEGAAVARAWPGAQFVRTTGLGHRRILRDPGVIARVTAFIMS